MGGEEFPGQKPPVPNEGPEKKPEPEESKGTPVDMTPDPNVPSMHQGEKLDPMAKLGSLDTYRTRGSGDGEEGQLPLVKKDTIEGK